MHLHIAVLSFFPAPPVGGGVIAAHMTIVSYALPLSTAASPPWN